MYREVWLPSRGSRSVGNLEPLHYRRQRPDHEAAHRHRFGYVPNHKSTGRLDDLAVLPNPTSEDPVARESSRLTCMAVYNGQTSYDPRFIRELFPGNNTYKHQALSLLYDVNLNQLDKLPKEKYELFEEVSSMTHLTEEDAPALLFYSNQMETPIQNQSIGNGQIEFSHADSRFDSRWWVSRRK